MTKKNAQTTILNKLGIFKTLFCMFINLEKHGCIYGKVQVVESQQ